MKTRKKIYAVLLTLVLALTMVVPVSAADKGSITVKNAVPGQSYSVYRIFDLSSYNEKDGAYIYTVNEKWEDFIKQDNISGTDGYVSVETDTGYVTWRKKDGSGAEIGMPEFAKLALAYAKDTSHSITATETKTAGRAAEDNTTVELKFEGLDLGYYLLDSNVGTLCSLNTTDPDVDVHDKNGQPEVEKKVQEDTQWGKENSAQIGDTVNFQVTITAQAGAQAYILHETMDDGLTFNANSVKASYTKNGGITSEDLVAKTNGSTSTYDYEVKANEQHGSGNNTITHTFDVVFTQDFCDKLGANDTIVVTYSAVLNDNADVTQGGANEVYLSYGEESRIETQPDETTTYTYRFQLIKTNDKDEDGKYEILAGAEFELYTDEKCTKNVQFVYDETTDTYRVATNEEINDTQTMIISTIQAGKPIIMGLDAKDYWLKETKAPDGYKPVESAQKITISKNNVAGNGKIDTTENTYEGNGGGVQVKNSKGSMLPSTGGIGTTIFYVAGGLLVIGALASLVVTRRRRRMSAEE